MVSIPIIVKGAYNCRIFQIHLKSSPEIQPVRIFFFFKTYDPVPQESIDCQPLQTESEFISLLSP